MSAHAGAGRGNKKSLVPLDSMLAPDFQHFHIHCIMVVVNHSLCLCSLGTAIHLADFPKVFAVTCGLPPLGIFYISEEIITILLMHLHASTKTEMNLLLYGPASQFIYTGSRNFFSLQLT